MIAFVQGYLEERTPAGVVLNCNGLGYALQVSMYTFAALPEKGDCMLYTHMAIREDAHVLYGFIEKQERDLFRLLISVSGVGGNTALAMLSSMNPSELKQVISGSDVLRLKSIKGVGPKTAERIVVDLRDKMGKVSGELDLAVGGNKNREEALTALVTLGFARNSATKSLDKIIKSKGVDTPVEELVRLSLSSVQ
jgi:Holliday junction DNA helicase RuvA